MDDLNKIRLLAGLPIDPKSLIREAYSVPRTHRQLVPKTEEVMKGRAQFVALAVKSLEQAQQYLESVPATDFNSDIAHYSMKIQQLISTDSGQSGLKRLSQAFQDEYNKWKRNQFPMEQQEQSLVSINDTSVTPDLSAAEKVPADMPGQDVAKFQKGDKVTYGDEQFVVVIDNPDNDVIGIAPAGQEGDIGSLKLVYGTEVQPVDQVEPEMDAASNDTDSMELGQDEIPDDAQVDQEGEAEQMADDDAISFGGDQNEEDDEDEFPVRENRVVNEISGDLAARYLTKVADKDVGAQTNADPHHPSNVERRRKLKNLPAKRLKGITRAYDRTTKSDVKEDVNYYYDAPVAQPGNVFDGKKSANNVYKPVTDRDENASQMQKLDEPSNNEQVKTVKVPAGVKKALKDAVKEVEKQLIRLGSTESDAKFFHKNVIDAYNQLLSHIEAGTVEEVKKAQIFMTTLMGPILHKIPAEVVNFVAKGGETKTLKDYFKEVTPYETKLKKD